jgi:glyoxylase-like metal-dependent hydrolase (beta-lactamase superfamily II)
MNRRRFLFSAGAASLGLAARSLLRAQTPAGSAPIPVRQPVATEFRELRRGVGLFAGRGGTIGWLANADAVAAVDTQFPDTAEIFLRDLPGRAGRKLDVVVNTHHHPDHTGGNPVLRPMARSMVAHANVPALLLARAEADKRTLDPATVPGTTFAGDWRMDLGGERVTARYFGPAHTKGDIIVHFEQANVVHLGDLMFNRLYPVIDRPGGASIRSWIGVLERAVAEYPADAIFIFGHGNAKFGVTGGPGDLRVFRDYLSALLAYVEAERRAGRSLDEVQKLENLPGFPDFHVPAGRGNRLPSNLAVAYAELAAG